MGPLLCFMSRNCSFHILAWEYLSCCTLHFHVNFKIAISASVKNSAGIWRESHGLCRLGRDRILSSTNKGSFTSFLFMHFLFLLPFFLWLKLQLLHRICSLKVNNHAFSGLKKLFLMFPIWYHMSMGLLSRVFLLY